MCLLGWDGESFNIVERGQLCYSTAAVYSVIDNGANSSGLYREVVFSLQVLLTLLYVEM